MRRLIITSIVCLLLPHALHAQLGSVQRLEIFPSDRILHAPHNTQQLAVIAHFADGGKRDVTQLTQFTSSDEETATVDRKARVTFAKAGEVAIYCRYQKVQAIRLGFADAKP